MMNNQERHGSGRGSAEPSARARRTAARVLSLNNYEDLARRYLPRPLFDYVSGACEDSLTLAANRAAMQRVTLLPRVLRDEAGVRHAIGLLRAEIDRNMTLLGANGLEELDREYLSISAGTEA